MESLLKNKYVMAKVSKAWIRENVKTLWGFGGQVTIEDIDGIKVPAGGFDTTLTGEGKRRVEHGNRKDKFLILLPGGLGWADCFGNYYGE